MFALRPPLRTAERLTTFHTNLAPVPVPPLRVSLDQYLKSPRPILEQNEEKGGGRKELRSRHGRGGLRTARLALERHCNRGLYLDRASRNNWLNDNFGSRRLSLNG